MKIGELVEAQSFRDGIIKRRVVEISEETVYICTDEEWQDARKTMREPTCVGFNRKFILSR